MEVLLPLIDIKLTQRELTLLNNMGLIAEVRHGDQLTYALDGLADRLSRIDERLTRLED